MTPVSVAYTPYPFGAVKPPMTQDRVEIVRKFVLHADVNAFGEIKPVNVMGKDFQIVVIKPFQKHPLQVAIHCDEWVLRYYSNEKTVLGGSEKAAHDFQLAGDYAHFLKDLVLIQMVL